ncbi:STAS domain-containing protein [candidate division KSB1 bacterium]|nr:STAS domain-containing protein [candidate division KSB1 bacterium]
MVKFIEDKIEGQPIFYLTGKIMGRSDSLILRDRLKALISSGEKNVILDFSKIKRINSPGMGILLSCVTSIRKNGGDFHFVALPERVATYFKITKLETVLKIYVNKDQVLKSIVQK